MKNHLGIKIFSIGFLLSFVSAGLSILSVLDKSTASSIFKLGFLIGCIGVAIGIFEVFRNRKKYSK